MVGASGEQFEISAAGYRAVVTESGGTLRLLEHAGRPLIDGFEAEEMPYGGRGQLLAPWPNRIGDGAYSFEGQSHQLAISEVKRNNASHGLVRWVAWTVEEHTANSVSLVYRLMAQSGYPWTLDLHVLYDLSADGLTVTQTATNLAPSAAPYASGAHPYLTVGPGPVNSWELILPARTRLLADDRQLPTGVEPVAGTPYDFTRPRWIGRTVLDHGFTDLIRHDDRATVALHDPATGRGVALWADARHRWLQVYTADDRPAWARRSIAIEPMTAPADAFRSGIGLTTLAPAGSSGDEVSASWGIRTL
jgi:aldose 1-epimerase